MPKIQINSEGVKAILRKISPEQAFAEYIWNGFDAGATQIEIDFTALDILELINEVTITDNGSGIKHQELEQKFKPFFESEKRPNSLPSNKSLPHGRDGVGRLTFFSFANAAEWSTVYENAGQNFEYQIKITAENLEEFNKENTEPQSTSKSSGTSVRLTGINKMTASLFQKTILEHLKQEFCWFLELYKEKSIKINGKQIDYEDLVGERESIDIVHSESGAKFAVDFVRWNKNLNNEYSRWYLVNSENEEIWKNATKLNNKGDAFFHSVFIRSNYFDDFAYDAKQDENEAVLFGHSKSDLEFKYLMEKVTEYLNGKRKPFLARYAHQLIKEYEENGVIPSYKDAWGEIRKNELENLIRGLYQIEPRLFSVSSIEQKTAFVRLLDALMDSNEREDLLRIFTEILDLTSEERKELIDLLKATKLSNVIRTIKLIKDRLVILDQIESLVFQENLHANERDHLQKIVDDHYWIFGEEYHLVCSTEAKFDKALRAYLNILGVPNEEATVTHKDKEKEMDIFLCRQNKLPPNLIENIVVELKHPKINLGEKEVSQVKTYMSVILSKAEFNDPKMRWKFILIGNKLSSDGYIEREKVSQQNHGEKEKGLIFKYENYSIYVKTWSEVLNEVKLRHEFLQNKLEIDKQVIAKEYGSAEEIMVEAKKSSAKAKMPEPIPAS